MKTTGNALVNRLRKVEDTPKAEKAKEAHSILVPTYMVTAKKNNVAVHIQCELADGLKGQLPAILAQVSPFSIPLSLSKLFDLIYCEVISSEGLRERMLSKAVEYGVVLKRSNRTSITVPEYVSDYIQDVFKAGSQKAFTFFLTWIIKDWNYIYDKIKLRGLQS